MQRGFSLITAIVGLGVAAIAVAIIAQVIRNSQELQKQTELRADFQAVRRYLLTAIDCEATFNPLPPACAGGQFLEVKSVNLVRPVLVAVPNVAVTPPQYTNLGSYSLRARCSPCTECTNGKKLLIEAAALKGSDFRIDPLTNKPLSWADINGGIPLGCAVP